MTPGLQGKFKMDLGWQVMEPPLPPFQPRIKVWEVGGRLNSAKQTGLQLDPISSSSSVNMKRFFFSFLLLLLSGLRGSLSQENLEGKAFVFPSASSTDFVELKMDLQRPLTSLTVCERIQTDVMRPSVLFSYATGDDDNEFLLHTNKQNILSVFMRQGIVNFDVSKVPYKEPTCRDHLCFTWESETGLAGLWWNGQPLPRKVIMKNLAVRGNASVVLGQEQDSFGGHFDANQCFVGEIEDVYFWDRVLQPDEICRVWHNRAVPRPLIDWRELHYEAHGEVIVAPSNVCACRIEKAWTPKQA